MESELPFDLVSLKRDWIVGVSGSEFSTRLTSWLKALEASPDGPILLALSDRVDFTVVFMAAVYLKRPLVLGNPKWAATEWEAVAAQIKPARVIGEAPIEATDRVSELAPGAILIPTGGTSGGVRFAMHDWASLSVAAGGCLAFMGSKVEVVLCCLPLHHVSGLMQMIRSFIGRLQLEFNGWEELSRRQDGGNQVTVISLVATQLERLLEDEEAIAVLREMQAIFIGGGPMRLETANRARAENLPLVLSYGMTETGAMVTATRVEDFREGAFHAGYALNHAKISIVNAAGELCPIGEQGRIRVESAALFNGYYAEKAEGLRGSRFETDDEGFLDERGHLHVVGRRDRMIQSGGEKVDPLEVETALLSLEGVEAALVFGQSDAEWVERVVAFYVATEELNIASGLAGVLAPHKHPKLCLRVDVLPLNAAGKLDTAKAAALLSATQ